MSKPSLVIVLVEDEHHEMLIRRYLRKCQFKPNDMRIRRSPPGGGSAESWIRREFVGEVNEYRNRQTRARTALIVVIDADEADAHAVQDRLNQLDQALTESGKQAVGGAEQIARLVPKLNVETWILCLNGEAVNEEDDYRRKRNDWNDLIPPAARTLRQWTRSTSEPPNHCVSSLRTGVQELKRLRF